MIEITKVCHNCKGKGIVTGNKKKTSGIVKHSKCCYCGGKGYRLYWDI